MAVKLVQTIPTNANVAFNAETVIATTLAYTYDQPNPFVGGEHSGAGQGVSVSGVIGIQTVGAAATQCQVRVRQGSLTGAVIGSGNAQIQPVTAGNAAAVPFSFEDSSRWCAQTGGGVYVLTVNMLNGTAVTSINGGSIEVQGA